MGCAVARFAGNFFISGNALLHKTVYIPL